MRGSNFFIPYATPHPAAHKTTTPSGAPHARGKRRAAATPHAARPIASIFIALSALSAIVPTHASIAHANTVACTRYTSTASVAIGPNARGTATHVPRHPKKPRAVPNARDGRDEEIRHGEGLAAKSNGAEKTTVRTRPGARRSNRERFFRERRPRVGASSTDGVKRLGRRVERRERRDGDGDGERARRAGPVDVVERAGRARARAARNFSETVSMRARARPRERRTGVERARLERGVRVVQRHA